MANKFQTGFDEPMLHTMFVDKQMSGLQCVQTLSRLNRTTSGKTGTFVMDFVNDWEEVQKSFQPYYQTTILEGETDPNKLYTLETEILNFHLILDDDIQAFAEIFFDKGKPQELLQPVLNRVVDRWKAILEEDREIFRSHINPTSVNTATFPRSSLLPMWGWRNCTSSCNTSTRSYPVARRITAGRHHCGRPGLRASKNFRRGHQIG
ncbi:MAG: type I restriction endonuclease subunit R [Saprospirales bacterium]|nr:type I restriction endonuclease subunit R [Saprospirales bacterium]